LRTPVVTGTVPFHAPTRTATTRVRTPTATTSFYAQLGAVARGGTWVLSTLTANETALGRSALYWAAAPPRASVPFGHAARPRTGPAREQAASRAAGKGASTAPFHRRKGTLQGGSEGACACRSPSAQLPQQRRLALQGALAGSHSQRSHAGLAPLRHVARDGGPAVRLELCVRGRCASPAHHGGRPRGPLCAGSNGVSVGRSQQGGWRGQAGLTLSPSGVRGPCGAGRHPSRRRTRRRHAARNHGPPPERAAAVPAAGHPRSRACERSQPPIG
jgi:hypothetical protein